MFVKFKTGAEDHNFAVFRASDVSQIFGYRANTGYTTTQGLGGTLRIVGAGTTYQSTINLENGMTYTVYEDVVTIAKMVKLALSAEDITLVTANDIENTLL